MRWQGKAVRYVLAGLLLAATVACSPEAKRTRGGGPGADIGNHGATVELHPTGPRVIYYETPIQGTASHVAGLTIQ